MSGKQKALIVGTLTVLAAVGVYIATRGKAKKPLQDVAQDIASNSIKTTNIDTKIVKETVEQVVTSQTDDAVKVAKAQAHNARQAAEHQAALMRKQQRVDLAAQKRAGQEAQREVVHNARAAKKPVQDPLLNPDRAVNRIIKTKENKFLTMLKKEDNVRKAIQNTYGQRFGNDEKAINALTEAYLNHPKLPGVAKALVKGDQQGAKTIVHEIYVDIAEQYYLKNSSYSKTIEGLPVLGHSRRGGYEGITG